MSCTLLGTTDSIGIFHRISVPMEYLKHCVCAHMQIKSTLHIQEVWVFIFSKHPMKNIWGHGICIKQFHLLLILSNKLCKLFAQQMHYLKYYVYYRGIRKNARYIGLPYADTLLCYRSIFSILLRTLVLQRVFQSNTHTSRARTVSRYLISNLYTANINCCYIVTS